MSFVDDNTDEIIMMLSVLAEPTRVRILRYIATAGELRSIDILPKFRITQPTLSHHMNLLTENGLVNVRKEGRCVYYSINRKALSELENFITELTEPPVLGVIKKQEPLKEMPIKKAAVLKKDSSVPQPKNIISSPDVDELKKNKKKKDKKKKDKDKKKKNK